MTTRTRILSAIAGVAVVAGLSSTLWMRHGSAPAAGGHLQATMVSDDAIHQAMEESKLPVSGLIVRTVGDIVVLRGQAPDAATADSAGRLVRSLGVQRVANMIRVPQATDDDAIRRDAERKLTQTRSLDSCLLRVSCTGGVLRVSGQVHTELQQDTVVAILRAVNGAQRIDTSDLRLVQLTAER